MRVLAQRCGSHQSGLHLHPTPLTKAAMHHICAGASQQPGRHSVVTQPQLGSAQLQAHACETCMHVSSLKQQMRLEFTDSPSPVAGLGPRRRAGIRPAGELHRSLSSSHNNGPPWRHRRQSRLLTGSEGLAFLSRRCPTSPRQWAHQECGRKAGGLPAGAHPRWAARCARRLRRPAGRCARPESGPSAGGTTPGGPPTPPRSRLQVPGGPMCFWGIVPLLLPSANLLTTQAQLMAPSSAWAPRHRASRVHDIG